MTTDSFAAQLRSSRTAQFVLVVGFLALVLYPTLSVVLIASAVTVAMYESDRRTQRGAEAQQQVVAAVSSHG